MGNKYFHLAEIGMGWMVAVGWDSKETNKNSAPKSQMTERCVNQGKQFCEFLSKTKIYLWPQLMPLHPPTKKFHTHKVKELKVSHRQMIMTQR